MEMKIERKDLFAETRMLNSVKAEQGAARLLERIENEDMKMEILPDNSVQFTGTLEEKDYISYCRFLESSNGKKILQMLEDCDAGKYVEL